MDDLASLKKYNIDKSLFKETFLKKFLFQITFLFLPKRILTIYVMLSLIAFIAKVKNIQFNLNHLNKEKISYLLNITLNEDILIIPQYTYTWLWKDDILDEEIETQNGKIKFRDILLNNELFLRNTHCVSKFICSKLPAIFKFKLNLRNKSSRLNFKHDIIKNIMFSF